MKISQFIVQDKSPEWGNDRKILHNELFQVNMRLFNSSYPYQTVISNIVRYMINILDMKFEDYPEGKGISGANIGIPFNIVVVRLPKQKFLTPLKKFFGVGKRYLVMINPRIMAYGPETSIKKSNCGSLLLKEKIAVERWEEIVVYYYNMKGKIIREKFEMPLASTIQHEIDHNKGILITDRAALSKDNKRP